MPMKKDPAAVTLGRKGGKARMRAMTALERSERASHAATVRWARVRRAKLDAEVDTRPMRPELNGHPHFVLLYRWRGRDSVLGRFTTEKEARLERKGVRGCGGYNSRHLLIVHREA